jgi:glycerophosphoryl diester phosphodiesterase
VSPRYSPLLPSAILFAHRGARAHAPENTLESFRLALRLGATGLESDAWVTADGVVVLDHDGVVGGLLRRRRISEVQRDQLPAHIPTLAELYEACGADFEFSLDVKDPAGVDEILRVAHAAGGASRLWLCHPDVDLLASWRERDGDVRLVNSTRLASLQYGPERRAAELRSAGIDAMNLHHAEWTPGLVALVHRFQRLGFGWDAQHVRTITALLHAGVDGIFSDHVDRMLDAVAGDRVPDAVPEELTGELPGHLPGELPEDLPGQPDEPT